MPRRKKLPGLLRFLSADNPVRIVNRGSVLIITLWSLFLLTTFAVSLSYGARQKIIAVERLNARVALRSIAEAGVKKAILELKKEDLTPEFDALTETWSDNLAAFKDIQVGKGKFTVGYDYLDRESSQRRIRYGIKDEERKININKADYRIIKRLFKIVGLSETQAQNLSAAIVDWRDSDSELSIPLGSAESRYYRNLRNPYEAKDRDFEVLDELFLVRGMTLEIFDKIKDFITIYGEGKVNINTASKEVLLSLGLQKAIVDKILSFREDNIFELPTNTVARLSQFCSLSASEVANLSNLVSAGNIVTASSNFMIKSIAKLDDNDASLEIACVFERFCAESEQAGLYKDGKIRYWREQLN